MNVLTLLEMAATGTPGRVGVGRLRANAPAPAGLTYPALLDRAHSGARLLAERDAEELVYVGVNADDFAVALFAAAWAGIPLVPLNYRLSRDALGRLLARHPNALVISDLQPPTTGHAVTVAQWRAACAEPAGDPSRWSDDPEAVAVLVYTSGTTSEPKAAVLRHRHLTSYLLGSVDFGAAGEQEAVVVSVPPYHIAGVSNLLSNICAGRRVVYLETFSAPGWLDCVRAEAITHALLVPTMLAKVTEHLDRATSADVPTLKSLAYGGAKMPIPVLERAIRLFPGVDFVNAYGLTETSSTIAVLGPDDHRAALQGDSVARARLGSAGRLLPGIQVEIRGPGGPLPTGAAGDIHVRGEQVSGEYRGAGSLLDENGWFATRDRGWVDEDGYLFVEGRTDDTIIRGGENIAPAEIEDVLLEHSAVVEAAVVGVPEEHWGHEIAAAVVLRPGRIVHAEELRQWVRTRLRGSKTPTLIAIRDALPQTSTGKVLRRELLADLLATGQAADI
ncbi:fatty acid--CoA ligase family protein [Mycobacterium sp. SMC-2]|uniref:class I adenylate-forming enzyme family protein n=1 Tax=Mycobacterium TaxID=1763 RepID=UPI001CE18CC3|nr:MULTISPECIES: fatty acid--CoA ligase family protein [Mycobacterium]MCA4760661.1 long-chain fatty acid--CoA ligase [Mycobacterium avium subsp. hominissuis]UXA06288.1 fatty acid--CoA ligase family protein [Mycobacterium sp. SMC-2]